MTREQRSEEIKKNIYKCKQCGYEYYSIKDEFKCYKCGFVNKNKKDSGE